MAAELFVCGAYDQARWALRGIEASFPATMLVRIVRDPDGRFYISVDAGDLGADEAERLRAALVNHSGTAVAGLEFDDIPGTDKLAGTLEATVAGMETLGWGPTDE